MNLKNINFQHLNYFLIAAKYQNFTLAADKLFVNYSTLSKAISSLESQLNVKLFERNGRYLKLTKFGKILNAHLASAMSSITDGLDEIQRITNQDSGQIDISSVYMVASKFLPPLLAKFRADFPNFTIDITQSSTQRIINNLLEGNIDIGFCGEFDYPTYKSQINREFIYNDEIILIVPKNHHLANRSVVSFNDIKNEQFIGWNTSAGMNYSIRQALNRVAGPEFELKTLYSMNEDSGVIGMVRAGLGIAFCSKNIELNDDNVVQIELSDLYIVYNIYMVWAKSEYVPNSLTTFKNFINSEITTIT